MVAELQKQIEFKKQIESSKSLKELFDTVEKFYDTKENLGFIAAGVIKKNIPNLIKMGNLKFKK